MRCCCLWGPYGTLGRLSEPQGIADHVHGRRDHSGEHLCDFSAGVWRDQAGLRYDEPLARRSFRHDGSDAAGRRSGTLPCRALRGAIVTGALLTFARAVGEFGSTILVSGNLASRTQTAPLYIFAKFNEGQVEAANAIAIVLALFSFVIFSILFFARDWLETD